MTFAQYIVFTEEMYESVVNYNAEDFTKVAVDAYPTVVIGVKLVSPLGKMPELRMMLKSFSMANWNLLSVYFIISLRIPSTPQAFFGLEGFYFVL